MGILIQIAVIIYLFAAFPVLLGLLWNKISKEGKADCAKIFVNGYFLMLALFMIVAVPAIRMSLHLGELSRVWLILSGIISGISILLCWQDGIAWCKNAVAFLKNSKTTTKIVISCFIVLSVVSIFFVKPHVEDYTISIVDTAVLTDSMYVYHPYTGMAYGVAPAVNVNSPIEMLYAVAAKLLQTSPALLIQFMLPIFLQIWFFLNYWSIGKLLFEEDEHKVSIFMGLILVLHLTPLYIQGQELAAGIFQNPWNGQTLLACCVLPGIFCGCLRMQKRLLGDLKWKLSEILKWIVTAVVVLLSAQLLYVRGIYYAVIMMVLFALTILIRKGILRYGTAFKNH